MSRNKVSRLQLINEFESASDSTLFNQNTLAAVLDCSVQLLERNRWAGRGVPYMKRISMNTNNDMSASRLRT